MGDHDRPAVAPQGVLPISASSDQEAGILAGAWSTEAEVRYLQQAGQLAVPVVDVLGAVLVAQGVDAVPQSQEGPVDVGPLLQTLPSVLGLAAGKN